jgi:hypothetical protein
MSAAMARPGMRGAGEKTARQTNMPVGTRCKGGGGLRPVPGTWKMQNDQTEGSRVSISIFDLWRWERERTSCFSRICLSRYMTGEVEAVMPMSGEARRERRKKFCSRVCFAYLLVCFRVSFASVTVFPFLLSFSSLGHSPRAPCRRIK